MAVHIETEAQSDSIGQPKRSIRSMMKDTLDSKPDFSRFLIDAKGFIPIPFIITEPALGGFGIAVAPTFITPKKRPPGFKGYIAPDITAGFGMYTTNKSWMLGVIRIGSFPSKGIKCRVGGGVGDINISFYRDITSEEEKEFEFSIKTVPLLFAISKRVVKQGAYLGLQYFFAKNELMALFRDSLPESIKSNTFKSSVASLGAFMDWDKRDNFLPRIKVFELMSCVQ
jgi:hypothetical protein